MQRNLTDWAKKENARLKRNCEILFIRKRKLEGLTTKQALQEWMSLIGRNYVKELDP